MSPGCGDSVVVVEDVPDPDVVVPGDVGPGVGPGPEPSHPTQMANIPSKQQILGLPTNFDRETL